MNTLLFPMDRVVSMDEIDDYFETRGLWNGKRFELACRRLGLNSEDNHMASRGGLDCTRFRPPEASGQMGLF